MNTIAIEIKKPVINNCFVFNVPDSILIKAIETTIITKTMYPTLKIT
jgi:hypothetical protein